MTVYSARTAPCRPFLTCRECVAHYVYHYTFISPSPSLFSCPDLRKYLIVIDGLNHQDLPFKSTQNIPSSFVFLHCLKIEDWLQDILPIQHCSQTQPLIDTLIPHAQTSPPHLSSKSLTRWRMRLSCVLGAQQTVFLQCRGHCRCNRR